MVRYGKWFAGVALGLVICGSVQAQTGGFGRSTLQPRSTPPTETTSTAGSSTTSSTETHQAAFQELIAQIHAVSVFVAAELGITPTTPEEEMLLFSISAQLYFAIVQNQGRGQSGFGGSGSGGGRGFGGGGGRASGTGGFGRGSLLGGTGTSRTTGTTSGRNRE